MGSRVSHQEQVSLPHDGQKETGRRVRAGHDDRSEKHRRQAGPGDTPSRLLERQTDVARRDSIEPVVVPGEPGGRLRPAPAAPLCQYQ